MEDVEQSGDNEDEACIEYIKVDLCCLHNACRTGTVLDQTIDQSSNHQSAGYVENDDPSLPGYRKSCALASRIVKDTAVDDVQDGSEEAKEV
jgi:hypothetical protein